MIFYSNVAGSWRELLRLSNCNTAFIVFKYFASDFWFWIYDWIDTAYFCNKLNQGNNISHGLAKSNVL